jgi:SAM-dependent methyltransferase
MNPATADRLIELNRGFYEKFGDSFSATRKRLQPGVVRILETLQGDEAILDLGCGNGELAQELARRGHHGPYLGVDSSLPLLREAQSHPPRGLHAAFLQADLTHFSLIANRLPMSERWNLVTAFAVLHHIPGDQLRFDLLRSVRRLLSPGGRLVLSNWQFLNSEKLKERIQPWEAAGLSPGEVDPDDYLLDWRRDGAGLRYVHHFSEEELDALAAQAGFRVRESFLSDGENQRLGLYQVWVEADLEGEG